MEEKVNKFRFLDTTATRKIFELDKRIRAVCGGTSASKTISIAVWCIDYAQTHKNELITIVSESFPHLSGGVMLDFENIMKDRNYWNDNCWVKNPKAIYTFETGTKIEFISVDTFGKAHGPRRDVLFINEANNLSFVIAEQLIVRTRKIIWMDWNPSSEFWFYTEMLNNRDDIDFITLTYLDNEALDETTVKEIETRKNRKGWWQVYGLGQLGEVEGKIYKDWQIINKIPHEAKLVRRGLDFGYSNDPTAIVDIYYYNGGYILDEITFQKGLLNKQIADIISNLEPTLTIADSAEPKSIAEISSYGISILGAKKAKQNNKFGSEISYVKWSIGVVQDQKMSITSESINLIKEYRNYLWQIDRNGVILNKPEHIFSHLMDAIRYAMCSIFPIKKAKNDFQNKPNSYI